MVHPVTRFAVRRPAKFHSLQLEFSANKRIQVGTFGDDIPSRGARRFFAKIQPGTHQVEDFPRKKCDLSFVIFLKIKESVAFDAASRNTFDFRNFNNRVIAGRLSVMAKIVVAR